MGCGGVSSVSLVLLLKMMIISIIVSCYLMMVISTAYSVSSLVLGVL
jgi:hypothetical protein